MDDAMSDSGQEGLGYERKDIDVRTVAKMTLLTIVVITVMIVGLIEYFVIFAEDIVYEQVLQPKSIQLQELENSDYQILNSYAVTDSVNRRFRIPIERAMELEAQEAFKQSKTRQ